MQRIAAVVVLAFVAPALAGCSNAAQAHSTQSPPKSASKPQSAHNLAMTKGVAAELIAAAAKINGHVPVSQYAGFEPTGKYYAYDPATRTYWAAGSLLPRTNSSAAAVSVQDNGSYNVFSRTSAGSWKAYDVGSSGNGSTTCPIEMPESVRHLWHWSDNSCAPPR